MNWFVETSVSSLLTFWGSSDLWNMVFVCHKGNLFNSLVEVFIPL